jgi:hypothetical protein
MDKKLTLKLNESIINNAKKYAKEHEKSLSKIVENYFVFLSEESTDKYGTSISPFVQTLANNTAFSVDIDLKQFKQERLENKYL